METLGTFGLSIAIILLGISIVSISRKLDKLNDRITKLES